MTKVFIELITVGAISLVTACNTATTDSKTSDNAENKEKASFDLTAARSAIDAANAKFMDGIKRGDSTAIAALYANDAWALPPNMEPVKGSAIAGLWGAVIRMGIKDAKFMTDEVTGNGEILAETAHYEMYGADNKLLDKGKYVVVWKPVNGEWKLYRDIWNSSMPPAK